MKKITLTLLLCACFLLTACNSENKKSDYKTSSVTTESTSSILETNNSSSSETQISSSSAEMTNEKALQYIFENHPDLYNENNGFIFLRKVDKDFLFEVQNRNVGGQGGPTTLGFYRVTPQGKVTETDSEGNPI